MLVTVIEKYKDKYYKTTYKFADEEMKREFIKLCEQHNCLVIEHKSNNSQQAV